MKKLLLILMLSTTILGNAVAKDNDVYYTERNAIGYNDAIKGKRFPASMSEITQKLGKVKAFDIAINTKNNQDVYVANPNAQPISKVESNSYRIGNLYTENEYKKSTFTADKIKVSDITNNQLLHLKNIELSSINDISFVRIYTDVPLTTNTIYSDNYKVTYTVGNGYLYKIVIGTKYPAENKTQKEYLTLKTEDYLSYNGYKSLSSLMNRNNKYIKDDIIVELDAPDETKDQKSLNYFNVSITNERLMQSYERNKNTQYNASITNSLEDFNRVMK